MNPQAMKNPGKIKIFLAIIVCWLSLELILQLGSLFLSPKMEKPSFSPGGGFDILCIGDSFTYGLGAPAADSYPAQLEKILNRGGKQKHIRVVNLGVPGNNSSECIKYLQKQAPLYNPKIVIMLAGMNNCWNFIDSSYFKIKKFKIAHPLRYRIKLMDVFLSRLKTYQLIKIMFINLKLRFYQLGLNKDDLPAVAMIKPQHSDKLQELLDQGLKYYEEGNYDLSEVCYSAAMKLAPQDYEPHWYMGRFYNYRGEKEKAKEELLLAAKYAWDYHSVVCILVDLQDRQKPKNSKYFKEYADLIKGLRGVWVAKFGEEYVSRFIDPIISYKENELEEALYYDFEDLASYLSQNKIKLVILTYPFSASRFRFSAGIYHRIANYLDVPLVDNVALFDRNLRIYERRELFASDGHCTSKGYGLMAENIAKVLKKYGLLLTE